MSWSAVGDLGINLLAAVIGFLAAQLVAWLRFVKRTRNARHFWRPFMRGEVSVVLSAHARPELLAWERSGLIGVGCVKALIVLQRKLLDIRESELPLKHAPTVRGD